jgi:predicted transcriptional regulator
MEKLMSKTNQVLQAFLNGEALTASQITARYGIANPHDTVYNLRNSGYAVYLNTKKNSKGVSVSKYRLGAPTRKVVAAGIAALGVREAGLV